MENQPLFSLRNVSKTFKLKKNVLHAVRGVSIDLYPNETFGLVGESGCGKSTIGKMLIKLFEPTAGEIFFEGKKITDFDSKESFAFRRQVQMIFQDPYSSLNPRMTAEEIIKEPLIIHKTKQNSAEMKKHVLSLISLVGLQPHHLNRFPHEFSGGQRQRIGIARALALNPKFIVCDEPIAALDVSIQAQIINLLKDLQKKLGLTYLFISHDLAMVKHLCNRVGVMYMGQIVELAQCEDLYSSPRHPYTQALLSAIPIPDPEVEKERKQILLKGEIPSSSCKINGCPFASRCPHAQELCHEKAPEKQTLQNNHSVCCHFHDSLVTSHNNATTDVVDDLLGNLT